MHVPHGRRLVAALSATALAAPLLLSASAAPALAAPATPRDGQLAQQLVDRSSGKGAYHHLRAFQAIAKLNDGNRAAGTRGHEMSAAYAGALLKLAGYRVSYQHFDFVYVKTLAEKLNVRTPEQREVPISLMTYTPSTPEGGTEAPLAHVPVDEDESTGCTAEDYADGDFTDRIALIQRGGCTFAEKQAAAAEAGATGAVIYNNTAGDMNGTLGDVDSGRIPTGGITQEEGEALVAQLDQGEVTVNLEVREFQEERSTPNVIAETRGGDPDNVVMLGAHLDSVGQGAGINDNASGAAGLLEVALQLARADHRGTHPNTVRFALWSAEELGLQGAEHYVTALSEAEREKIALYLNFDMIASPNYGLFVYDGDNSEGAGEAGPEGSARLEQDLTDFFSSRGLETRATVFDGRSDYGPFIEAGIPAGGTFTGAEGTKTAAQVELWGGTEGEAYDPCYHTACDDLGNVDREALDANVRAIANAVGTYAWDSSLPEPAGASGNRGGGSDTGGGHRHQVTA